MAIDRGEQRHQGIRRQIIEVGVEAAVAQAKIVQRGGIDHSIIRLERKERLARRKKVEPEDVQLGSVGAGLGATTVDLKGGIGSASMQTRDGSIVGALAVVNAVGSLEEAYERANGTEYGLQAGIFTGSIATALAAAQALDFGGVTVNEAPTFRADQMPYGGVKGSGNTKEGPAYTIREMTEERLVVLQA